MATEPTIDYEALQQDAMRGVVRAVLHQTVKNGLPGDHHFYVSFLTHAPGVIVSKRLREKYPHEMTIVLQHRFWDLSVSDDRFEVKLTFDSIPERLVIPYAAIKVFIDPSVRFGLQFEDAGSDQERPAPRRSLTVDSAFDQVGEARAESPRATIAKKPRAARKPKTEKDPSENKGVPPTQPSSEPIASDQAPVETPGKAANAEGSAKILSLDQFRKK
ncbi:MAG: SspB family protein [Hyphomicrobium sp.]